MDFGLKAAERQMLKYYKVIFKEKHESLYCCVLYRPQMSSNMHGAA